MSIFVGSVLALGEIVSSKPLEDLRYKGWNGDQKSFASPYASSVYLGWAMASAIALVVTSVLPIISWFATYRFSLSSAICIGIFSGIFFLYVCTYKHKFLFYYLVAACLHIYMNFFSLMQLSL